MNLPHSDVYARLGVSPIHGIGVFAIVDIPVDTLIFYGDENTLTVEVPKSIIEDLPAPMKKLYEDFCVLQNEIYTCPTNFNQLTISWYLNCSKNPNVRCGNDLLFYSSREIKAGEELTVDYDTYSE